MKDNQQVTRRCFGRLVVGRKLLNKHGLSDWKFQMRDLDFSHSEICGKRGLKFEGRCLWETKTIQVDCRVKVGHGFRLTVLHEIAHALTPTKGHTREWADNAVRIGCTRRHVADAALRKQ